MICIGGDKKKHLYIGGQKIRHGYVGASKVYSAGNMVTYVVDTGVTYAEEAEEGLTVLSPTSFVPTKAGWTFAGWRQDTTAGAGLTSLNMAGDPITLYAVFNRTLTLSYNGNGNTGGATATQTGVQRYNNGVLSNPSIALRANGFTRTNYTFSKWAMGSTGGTQYAAGATVTISANVTMYALWTRVSVPFYWAQNYNAVSPQILTITKISASYTDSNPGNLKIEIRGNSAEDYGRNPAWHGQTNAISTKGNQWAEIYIDNMSAGEGYTNSVSIGGKTFYAAGTYKVDVSNYASVSIDLQAGCYAFGSSQLWINYIRFY